jgi:hypothetical protein
MSNAPDRIRVGVRLAPPEEADVSAWLTHGSALDAAGADALFLNLPHDGEHDPVVLLASLASVTHRCLLVLADHAPGDRTAHTLDVVSRGRVVQMREVDREEGEPAAFERSIDDGELLRWEQSEMPAGRAAWKEALGAAATRGVHGLIVPADPRLLDLLRNPDEEIDRRDLQLASG